MKKTILSAMLLLSVSCLLGTQARASECPKEHPFLIKRWKNENCTKFDVYPLRELGLLELPKWRKIVDYKYNPNKDDAHFLPKLEEIREKIHKMEERQENVDKTIHIKNSKIEEENQKIREKNKIIYNILAYGAKCSLEDSYHKSWHTEPIGGDLIFIESKSETLLAYIKECEQVIADNQEKIEGLKKYILAVEENNLSALRDNMLLEKEIDTIISEFEKFYTPKKEKQLLAEYEKAISENCVGCDYPKPLQISENSCKECPNREYVDGKCVLKQNNRKKGK